MTDWRSYDAAAATFDALWQPRFVEAATQLVGRAPADAGRWLDVGCGTGAVGVALRGRAVRVTGCDLSTGMLVRARRNVPDLGVVQASATALPFRDRAFDVASASFVLSHVANADGVLAEMRRVLAAGGTIVVSGWGPPRDPYDALWQHTLEAFAGAGFAEEAAATMLPSEGRFARPESMAAALRDAGLETVDVIETSLTIRLSLEAWLSTRAVASAGRLARQRLGEASWDRLVDALRDGARALDGDDVVYDRTICLGRGSRG